MNTPRHFLTLNDLSTDELLAVLRRASELKQMQRKCESTSNNVPLDLPLQPNAEVDHP